MHPACSLEMEQVLLFHAKLRIFSRIFIWKMWMFMNSTWYYNANEICALLFGEVCSFCKDEVKIFYQIEGQTVYCINFYFLCAWSALLPRVLLKFSYPTTPLHSLRHRPTSKLFYCHLLIDYYQSLELIITMATIVNAITDSIINFLVL